VYAVLGEHASDALTVKVLMRRLSGNRSISIKTKGFQGGGDLLNKGAKQLNLFKSLGCDQFVVCYDADGPDPEPRRIKVMQKVVAPSGLAQSCCVVIPVQEIEAWILADIEAVTNVFRSWCPGPFDREPEREPKPKELLERLSRLNGKKPIYAHATHNPKVAEHLDLERVRKRCSSFEGLCKFIIG